MAERKKSNTVYLELPAVFEWAKVFDFNMDRNGPNGSYEAHGGAYTVDLLLTKDVYKQLVAAGSQKTPMVLYNDKWYSEKSIAEFNRGKDKAERMPSFDDLYDEAERVKVKVIRKHDAPYSYGGAPQVAHADGSPWDTEDDGQIGNGSKGIAYVSVYEAGGLKGTRLDGIQILDLVEYISDYDPDDDSEPRGFKIPDRSKAAGTTKKETKPAKVSKTTDIEEDVIPF